MSVAQISVAALSHLPKAWVSLGLRWEGRRDCLLTLEDLGLVVGASAVGKAEMEESSEDR